MSRGTLSQRIDRTTTSIGQIFNALAAIALAVILFSVLYSIFARVTGLGNASWTFDLSSLLMLPLTYFAMGYALSSGRHVEVGLVSDSFPNSRIVKYGLKLGAVVLVVLCTAMLMWAWWQFMAVYDSGRQTGSARITTWPFTLALPIGVAVLALASVARIFIVEDTETAVEGAGEL